MRVVDEWSAEGVRALCIVCGAAGESVTVAAARRRGFSWQLRQSCGAVVRFGFVRFCARALCVLCVGVPCGWLGAVAHGERRGGDV